MNLNIRLFTIIVACTVQFIGFGYYCQSWGDTIYKNYNNTFFHNYINDNELLHPKKERFLNKINYITHPLDIINYPNDCSFVQLYKKNKYFKTSVTETPNIHIQNDSINVSHVFYNSQNKYKKILPFFQIGIQNILSNKVFSVGGGNRYVYNDFCAIGYNTFYHFPFSNINSVKQPNIINVSGEYWYNNILLMLNSFHTMNNLFHSDTQTTNNKKYPIHGYQICIHTQLPNLLSAFSGKMILEHYFYNKKIKNNLLNNNNINKNYYLTVGMDYHPIPILGFSINKTITRENINHTTYKILIDYKFGVPLTQQINYINSNIKRSFIFDNINKIIPPFIPIIYDNITKKTCDDQNNDYDQDQEKNIFQHYYTEIIGYPGETKIIKIKNDENEKPIQWDMQSIEKFQSYGGKISFIQNNTYIIFMPYKLITNDNKVILSYYSANNKSTNDPNVYTRKKILILIKNFKKHTPLMPQSKSSDQYTNCYVNHNVKSDYKYIPTIISDNEKKSSPHLSKNISLIKKNKNVILKKNISLPTIVNPNTDNKLSFLHKKLKTSHYSYEFLHDNDYYDNKYHHILNSDNNITNEFINKKTTLITKNEPQILNYSTITPHKKTPPTPPPLPLIIPLMSSPLLFHQKDDINNYSSLPSSYDMLHETAITSSMPYNMTIDPQQSGTSTTTIDNDNLKNGIFLVNNNKIINKQLLHHSNNSQKEQNIIANNPNPQQDLLHALSMHKQQKFSTIGTPEHINKLENTVINRKKQHFYSNEMEKIFSKLQITRSNSSIEGSYETEYDSSSNDDDNLYASFSNIN